MKLNITWKLFLALITTCLTVILLMSATLRLSFERGLLDYVNKQAISKSSALIKLLANNYEGHHGWASLREERSQWHEMLGEVYGPPPPFLRPPHAPEGPPDTAHSNRPPDELGLAHRVTVLDEHREYVAGNPEPSDNAASRPITVNGATVGWLLISPDQSLTDVMALTFKREQNHVIYIVSAISSLLAISVAVFLARVFLSPIRRLASGMQALSAGSYRQEISVQSRDEMGELAQNFNRLAQTLQKNDEARRRWIADISHELRTPLAILRGEVEAMNDGVRPLDQGSIKSLMAEMKLLSKLVDDLYDLSLSDAGALAYRKTDIDVLSILELTMENFRESFRQKNVTLRSLIGTEKEAKIFGDEVRLGQLFSNLLQNSLRYTDAGGELRVSAERGEREIAIDFQDTPSGVPEQALPFLFDRLYRVDEARTREQGGTGLGLSICKNIVEAHYGTIEARHSSLGGLWIRVTLPFER